MGFGVTGPENALLTNQQHPMNTIFRYASSILLLLGGQVFAQIPNAGFETWEDYVDYIEPAGWITLNEIMAMLEADPSVEQVAPGHSGAFAARITSIDVPGLGLYPGLLITGDPETGMEGFPFAQRPASLEGMWKVDVPAGDLASVNVVLSRWDPLESDRVIIGYGSFEVQGSVPQWTAFTVPIDYYETELPDSATIAIFSGQFGGVDGSSLWIDDLAFTSSTGIAEGAGLRFQVYPVPTRDDLVVEADGSLQHVLLHSMDGRTVLQRPVMAQRAVLDMRSLPPGAYYLEARLTDGRTLRRQVVKQ